MVEDCLELANTGSDGVGGIALIGLVVVLLGVGVVAYVRTQRPGRSQHRAGAMAVGLVAAMVLGGAVMLGSPDAASASTECAPVETPVPTPPGEVPATPTPEPTPEPSEPEYTPTPNPTEPDYTPEPDPTEPEYTPPVEPTEPAPTDPVPTTPTEPE